MKTVEEAKPVLIVIAGQMVLVSLYDSYTFVFLH